MRNIKFRAWCNYEKKIYHKFYIEEHMTYAFLSELIDSARERYDLMQYTGLKDDKGTGIYEGDIVEIFDRHITKPYEVWAIESMDHYDKMHLLKAFTESETVEVKVIGNIYEHPELMEVE